jgi:hypothetical protein
MGHGWGFTGGVRWWEFVMGSLSEPGIRQGHGGIGLWRSSVCNKTEGLWVNFGNCLGIFQFLLCSG